MEIRTNVKAGGRYVNHNESASAVVVRTSVRAGGQDLQHNESAVSARAAIRWER